MMFAVLIFSVLFGTMFFGLKGAFFEIENYGNRFLSDMQKKECLIFIDDIRRSGVLIKGNYKICKESFKDNNILYGNGEIYV